MHMATVVSMSYKGSNHKRKKDSADEEGNPLLLAHFLHWKRVTMVMRMRANVLDHSRYIEEGAALLQANGFKSNSQRQPAAPTDINRATPVQFPAWAPMKLSRTNETSVPTGVAALKTATCFFISERGREVDSSEDVRARAVGAT
jgi:hypothetical protein